MKKGRDCLWLAVLLSGIASTCPAQGEDATALTTPSGLQVTLQDVLTDDPEGQTSFRFRFIAPAIAQGLGDVEQNIADMEHLCQTFALPNLRKTDAEPRQIVISLAAAPTEFGVPNPDIRQVFEAFSVQNTLCIWEPF